MKETFEPKENSGTLFKVPAEKRKGDTWPEYEGDVKIRCPHCEKASLAWIKAWVREAKNGGKYFSIALKHRQRRE